MGSVRKWPITASDVGWTVQAGCIAPGHPLKRGSARRRDCRTRTRRRPSASPPLAGWSGSGRARPERRSTSAACGSGPLESAPTGRAVRRISARDAGHRPDLFVATAAYGDYAPAYIGTAIAYDQGGYETQPTSSNVAPEVEGFLLDGLRRLLDAKGKGPERLGIEAAAAETESRKEDRGP